MVFYSMQMNKKTVANVFKITNLFTSTIRKDKAFFIAAVITSLITNSKVSLFHLACYGASFIQKASYEQKMRRLLDRLGITPLIWLFLNSVENLNP